VFQATSVKPSSLSVTILLGATSAALSRVDVHLAVLATCLSMRRLIREGYVTRPGYALGVYAAYLNIMLGDARRSQEIGRSSLMLAERIADSYTPRTQLVVHGLLYPFLMRRRQAIAPLERIAEASQELGDPEFAHYARFLYRILLAFAGDPVRETRKHLEQIASRVRGAEQFFPEAARCFESWALLGARPDSGPTLDAAIERVDALFETDVVGSTYSHTLSMLVLSVYGRHAAVFERSERVIGLLFRVSPFVHVADHLLYRGLAAAALASSARGWTRWSYARSLRRSLRYLRRRAQDGPDFVHMASFLEAELARLRKDATRARACYEQAVQRARQQAFPHHAALAQERRASLLQSLRRESEAQTALEDAIAIYREWGAEHKVKLLSAELKGPMRGL
jgi:tetratricopeptide (TPR) repeat protein